MFGLAGEDGEVEEDDEIFTGAWLYEAFLVTVTAFGTPNRAMMGPVIMGVG